MKHLYWSENTEHTLIPNQNNIPTIQSVYHVECINQSSTLLRKSSRYLTLLGSPLRHKYTRLIMDWYSQILTQDLLIISCVMVCISTGLPSMSDVYQKRKWSEKTFDDNEREKLISLKITAIFPWWAKNFIKQGEEGTQELSSMVHILNELL